MSTKPRVSIGLPVYNGERYLATSIDALLGQTLEDFELIISDNSSTDGTAEICRHYEQLDARVRYVQQPRNIGAALNHYFVFQEARSSLFKWAAADDLYARELLERCVEVLDERPDVVLAHSWVALIDDRGSVTHAFEYPLATDSPSAPVRLRSILFGDKNDDGFTHADDQYGVIRAEVLRRVLPQGSFYNSDRAMMAAIALHGPFHQTPEWLYFRRDHAGRPQHACPTVRSWCTNMDPRRADAVRHPTIRLVAEYPLGFITAIRHAPLSSRDRRDCYRSLARWAVARTLPAAKRALRGRAARPPLGSLEDASIGANIPGPEESLSCS